MDEQTSESIRRIIEDAQDAVILTNDDRIMRWKNGLFETTMTVPQMHATVARDKSGMILIGRNDDLFRIENNSFTKIETVSADAGKFMLGTLFVERDRKNLVVRA